ncbi:Tm-1-like ATP-binding domain-containing protein [bacterium]|nr:Tm-1-like ATP-binding domain-containing protein [bacterium]
MAKSIYAIGTLDTKGPELSWLAGAIRACGFSVQVVDVGTLDNPKGLADISREQVLGGASLPSSEHRGDAIRAMGDALRDFLIAENSAGRVAGVIGIGGSGGTSLITTALRSLPIGLPKIMLSTVASGNTAPYLDCSDITMMYSVVDVAGLNAVSRKVFANAAHAIVGMVQHQQPIESTKPALGMTMFGVTTPCVTQIREALESDGYDCLVFHATGTGGRAMEQLVRSDLISGVLDLTTTEVADQVVGGVFPAGPDRFDALIEKSVPLVISLGAIDMVNFGSLSSVPECHQNRILHVHNAEVTLMRTSADENESIANWIAEKLNRGNSSWTLLIPEQGVSSLDSEGQPFHDPTANDACFETLESKLKTSSNRRIRRVAAHINDTSFARVALDEFRQLMAVNTQAKSGDSHVNKD